MWRHPLAQQVCHTPTPTPTRPHTLTLTRAQVSTELLVGPDSVEGVVESAMALALALAQQWFGVLLQPGAPEDAWLLEGLAAYLADVFGRAAFGQVRVVLCVHVCTCGCLMGAWATHGTASYPASLHQSIGAAAACHGPGCCQPPLPPTATVLVT